MQIRVAHVRGDHEPYARRAANALGAIAEYDPARFARIQRDIGTVLIWPYVIPGAVAQFHRRGAVCAIDSAKVIDTPATLIALWIVHEATHARLARFHANDALISRIEGICKRQELAFAQRTPRGDRLVAALQAEVDWHLALDHSRHGQVDRAAVALAAEGAPRWALALLRAVMRFVNGSGNGRPAA
jgi:hypothetical protein